MTTRIQRNGCRVYGRQATERAARKREQQQQQQPTPPTAYSRPQTPPTRGAAPQDDFHNRRWQDGPPRAWQAQHDAYRDQVLLREGEL